MSVNTGHKPRHIPGGRYAHECAYCGVIFRTNSPSTRYCTFAHKNAFNNHHFYAEHRKTIILAVMLRAACKRAKLKAPEQASKSRKATKSVEVVPDPDKMTNEQLLEWVRNNPGKFKVK